MRTLITTIMIVVGLGLMIISYALAAPTCNISVDCADPRVPFAAGIFVLGIVTAFSSAIFYSVYKGAE